MRTREKLDFFQELGALVERRWREKHFDNAAFSQVAFAALEDIPPCQHVHFLEIVQEVMAADQLPPQDLQSHFGQPPLTLFKSDSFYIDALFWLDAPTQIHEHSFAGAFHILEGSSLHCRYDFEPQEYVSPRFLIGDVRLQGVEFLRKGDTRTIFPGAAFSHSTFHLEKPSVTIVVRTATIEAARPQYTYLKPSVAYDPFARCDLTTRQLELLDLLHAVSKPDYLRQLRELLSTADLETTFWLLDQSHRHLDASEFAPLFEAASHRRGDLIQRFVSVFQESRRMETINSRCPLFDKPQHRLLLGLLMGLPDRASIFKFIREHYTCAPFELISTWVEGMTAARAKKKAPESNALGVRFDELSLCVFKSLLEGLSFAGVMERLKQEYNSDDVEAQKQELHDLTSAFQTSVLFRPLFVGSQPATVEPSGKRSAPKKTEARPAPRASRRTSLLMPA